MKNVKILFAAITLLVSQNSLSEPISSLPKYEKKIFNCLQNFSNENRCIGKIIKKHLPEGNEAIMPVADQVEEIFVKWLATDKVANIYPVSRKEIGEFVILQAYIIEDTSASVLLFEMTYRKALGKWYVLNFNINSKQESIKSKLGY